MVVFLANYTIKVELYISKKNPTEAGLKIFIYSAVAYYCDKIKDFHLIQIGGLCDKIKD